MDAVDMDDSAYSLDLSALDLESNSSSPKMPKQRVDRVLSEDIDGPTDFTINMGKWMRSGGQDTVRSARKALPGLQSRLSTPQHGREEDEHSASHHTPTNSPPKESVWLDETMHEDDGPGSSEWDPYEEPATPYALPPVKNKHLLQPTVEDYDSEMVTPARAASPVRVGQGTSTSDATTVRPASALQFNTSPKQVDTLSESHISPSKSVASMHDDNTRPSSPTLSPVRSPPLQRPSHSFQPSSRSTFDLQKQIRDLQARCDQIEQRNKALSEAINNQRRTRTQETAAHEAQLTQSKQMEQDLRDAKQTAQSRVEDFRAEFMAQKVRIRELEAKLMVSEEDSRQGSEMLVQLAANPEGGSREAAAKLHDLTEELRLARIERNAANKSTKALDDLLQKLEEHRQNDRLAHEDEVALLRTQLQSSTQETPTSSKQQQLQLEAVQAAAQADMHKLRTELTASSAEVATLRNQLEQQDLVHVSSTQTSQRATKLAESLSAQLKELQLLLRDEQSAHDSELDRLEVSHDAVQSALQSEVDELRGDIEAQHSLLNAATLDRDDAVDDLSAAQAKISTLDATVASLKAEVEVMKVRDSQREAVNSLFEAGMSERVRKREAYWRKKMEAWEVERRVMVKALMRLWGREDVGDGVPQGFEYLFEGAMNGKEMEV